MLREGAGAGRSNGNYVEHRQCEIVRQIHDTIHASRLDSFTFSLVDPLWIELREVVHALDRLPGAVFKGLIDVILGLREARNELGLACFLFDLQEINSVHRLVLRNKAVLRSKHFLRRTLEVWPVHASTEED